MEEPLRIGLPSEILPLLTVMAVMYLVAAIAVTDDCVDLFH